MSSTLPKISIITINYNDSSGLQKTFDSVFGQTWQDFEYVVIDGGSTDGSKELIEHYQNQIDYWVSEPDSGIYNAMNKGIAVATGEYLLFLNAGDHFYSNTVLEENLKEICDADVISFDIELIENSISKIHVLPKTITFSVMFQSTLAHQSTFIKRLLFDELGKYDEQYLIVADWTFFMNIFFNNKYNYKKVNEILTTFYLGGISNNVKVLREERKKFLNNNFPRFVLDYDELIANRKIINTNRIQMLLEIEKSWFGKKMVSLLFRLYIFCFSKRKLNDILIEFKKTYSNRYKNMKKTPTY